jgi:hypothetical protein
MLDTMIEMAPKNACFAESLKMIMMLVYERDEFENMKVINHQLTFLHVDLIDH